MQTARPSEKNIESAIFFKKEMTFLLVYVKSIYIILENFMKFRPGIFELSSQNNSGEKDTEE